MCPLCRVAHKADREYLWHFFEEYAGTELGSEALRRARGFCLEHAAALRRLEVDGLRSTLGISEIYEDAFTGIVEQLGRISEPHSTAGPTAACPACGNREAELDHNARYLVDMLRDEPRTRDRYQGSTGLCLPHFALVWSAAGAAERTLLLEVQRRVATAVLAELTEHIRKQGSEARHEPPGPEHESWERAMWLTAGWPPPTDLIGQPERETDADDLVAR